MSDRNDQSFTPNQAITAKAVLTSILGSLAQREAELSAVLPPDITFAAFHASVNQALRANPDLLTCEPRSLLNACIKAAYDGLRIDGREAAIVWDMLKVPGSNRKVKTARYMPMYQGLVQQLLRGGLVLACEADVIYANDVYDIIRGSTPQIVHKPLLLGDRGPPVAVYNVATLKSGYRTSAYLTWNDVLEIARESKSGWDTEGKCLKGVWAKWTREQAKKTILRQHRKTLPVGERNVIRDMEQSDDFPQFDRTTAHPQFAAVTQGPRPTRAAIADRGGTEAGEPLDFGQHQGEPEGLVVDHRERGDEQREQRQSAAVDERRVALPEDDAAWAVWGMDLEAKIAAATSIAAVESAIKDADEIYSRAAKSVRDRIAAKAADRKTDLALGADNGGDYAQ